ncbi:hypothetical protein B0H14DRAFT_3140636 [Mycena olivaceomarginata]|nr:hypothetical protein B0H14DRAFT_3140636 [Mycena olivaceomarginata]
MAQYHHTRRIQVLTSWWLSGASFDFPTQRHAVRWIQVPPVLEINPHPFAAYLSPSDIVLSYSPRPGMSDDVSLRFVNNSGICETAPGVHQMSGYVDIGTNMAIDVSGNCAIYPLPANAREKGLTVTLDVPRKLACSKARHNLRSSDVSGIDPDSSWNSVSNSSYSRRSDVARVFAQFERNRRPRIEHVRALVHGTGGAKGGTAAGTQGRSLFRIRVLTLYNVYSSIYDDNSSIEKDLKKLRPSDGAQAHSWTAQRKDTLARVQNPFKCIWGAYLYSYCASCAAYAHLRSKAPARQQALHVHRVGHTRHTGATKRIAWDACMALGARVSSCRRRVSAAGRGGKKPDRDTQRGPGVLCDTAVAGADVRGCSPHTRCDASAGRQGCAHADDDASCEVLYGGAERGRVPRLSISEYLAPRLVRACSGDGRGKAGRRRAKAQARTTHRRAAHAAAARREAQGQDDAGSGSEAARESAPRGEAEADRAAHAVDAYRASVAAGRLLRVDKSPRALALARMPGVVWGAARLPYLHVFACLGSRSLFLLPFSHPSFSPRAYATRQSLPLPPPLAPAGVRRSACGSWGVGLRPSWVSVRQSEPQSWVWVRSGSLLPPTLLLHAGLSLEVRRVPGSRRRGTHRSGSLVRIRPPMAKTHSADGVLSGGGVGLDADAKEVLEANTTADGADDVDVRRGEKQGGFPVRKGFDHGIGIGAAVADLDARRSGCVMGGSGVQRGGARRVRRSVGVYARGGAILRRRAWSCCTMQ